MSLTKGINDESAMYWLRAEFDPATRELTVTLPDEDLAPTKSTPLRDGTDRQASCSNAHVPAAPDNEPHLRQRSPTASSRPNRVR